jgi:hypothetical protein
MRLHIKYTRRTLRQIDGFSGPSVSSSNKADRHNIAEILLKVALNTIKQTAKTIYSPKVYIVYKVDIQLQKCLNASKISIRRAIQLEIRLNEEEYMACKEGYYCRYV